MYLEYSEFEDMGGTVNEDAFPRFEAKARTQIDRATHGRLAKETPVRNSVKYCVFELISAIAAGESVGGIASGRAVASMSNDGVSVSFAQAGDDAGTRSDSIRYFAIIRTWLDGETDANGTPLLYAGVDA
jgi:hypothetical protein